MPGDVSGVPQVCMSLVLRHQQLVDSPHARRVVKRGEKDPSPFPSQDEERRIRHLSASCYTPATECLIRMMDEGFSCGLLLSGVLLECLEGYEPDLYDLIREAATHRHAELLTESYFCSVVALFGEAEEYQHQVEMHQRAMEDLFGRRPSVLVATDSIFNWTVITAARKMGISAVYTDVFGKNTPLINPLKSYQAGGLPVFIRHCELSDDIALRYGEVDWVHHPLSPGTYAGWLSAIRDGIAHVMINMEVFGGRFHQETGILSFLEGLPAAFHDTGVCSILPSEAAVQASSPDQIPDELIESASAAWPVNMMQCTALEALKAAGRWVSDRTTLRRFQARDHFSQMAATSGSCGMLTDYRTQSDAYQYFSDYFAALCRFEGDQIGSVRAKSAARILRCIPPKLAFHFCTPYHREGFSAHSLEEFVKLLNVATDECILHHCKRLDFEHWIRDVINDPKLADEIHPLTDREDIQKAVIKRVQFLWNRLK